VREISAMLQPHAPRTVDQLGSSRYDERASSDKAGLVLRSSPSQRGVEHYEEKEPK
jgi:hypothetical protein